MNRTDDIHELAGLLPFYVNGRLDAEQRARIDAVLATTPELRAELAAVQALHDRLQAFDERLHNIEPASPAGRLLKLQARIAEETSGSKPAASRINASAAPTSITATSTAQPVPQTARGAPAVQSRFSARRPRFLPSLSMALATGLAAVCMVQSAMLYRLQLDDEGNGYMALSGPTDHAATGSARFTLRFREGTPWSEIQGLCDKLHLRIVDGPEDGMIDVAPASELDAAEVEAVQAALERSSSVAFVGRRG